MARACIVERQVEPAEFRQRLFDKASNGFGISDVRWHRERIAASVLAANTTAAPASAKARAEAAPMLRLAPVTMATLPSSSLRVVTQPSPASSPYAASSAPGPHPFRWRRGRPAGARPG